MKTLIVCNPHAANGRAGKRWPELKRALERLVPHAEQRLTTGPGHATTIVREALLGGAQRIVTIGGDGTNSEVVNGFFADGRAINPDAVLAIVPSGTGGDFRRTIGLPEDPVEAAAVVLDGEPRPIDIGRISYVTHDGRDDTRFFLNIASFGMGGLVDRIVNETSKRLGGKASFLMASVRALARYRNQRVHLVLDHGRVEMELPVFNVAVCNGRYFGGGMFVAPSAEIDDGRLEVVVLGDLSLAAKLMLTTRIYKGTHVGTSGVLGDAAVHVRAESTEEVLLDVDGEAIGRLPATFDLLPGALRLQSVPR